MDNQHRKITGYRELNQAEIDLMNLIKHEGVELKGLHDKIEVLINERETESGASGSESRRWLAIGRTQYQQGLMALTRAVAAPNFE